MEFLIGLLVGMFICGTFNFVMVWLCGWYVAINKRNKIIQWINIGLGYVWMIIYIPFCFVVVTIQKLIKRIKK